MKVTLAGDKEMDMKLTETGVILGAPGTEPVVPMGLLTSTLGCDVSWNQFGLKVHHPEMGELKISIEDGCPMVSKAVALKLIQQIERKAEVKIRSLKLEEDHEVQWLKKLVNEHPAFQGIPGRIKEKLVEIPAHSLVPMANRRTRKLWKKKGLAVHVFSGANEGYTLKRAFHEAGGDRRLLHELDVLHGKPETDLGEDGKAYPLLLRLALNGQVKAWVGGLPCRTRSVLRHQEVAGCNLPRPLRAWDGEEFGKKGLAQFEQDQVEGDDLLLLRFLFLYVVSEMVRSAKGEDKKVEFLVEQPADPIHYPEVVTPWRTDQWKRLKKSHGLSTQTFNQSEFGTTPTKPTTLGGTIQVAVPLQGRKGSSRCTRKVSGRDLQ